MKLTQKITREYLRITKTYNTNSVILWEDETRLVVATGLDADSDNTKTGAMVQIYIIHRTVKPILASKLGLDIEICGDCPHRGFIADGVLYERRCYVNIGQAPTSIFSAYHRGSYRYAHPSEYAQLFGGRIVRFGAYGDPVYVPFDIIAAIAAVAADWTGYTHQWRNPAYAAFKPYVMASVDSEEQAAAAVADGWRYFRVGVYGQTELLANEIICPASVEAGKKTTCEKCKLCNGRKFGETDVRKNIVIRDHSAIARTKPMNIQAVPAAAMAAPAAAGAFTILQ